MLQNKFPNVRFTKYLDIWKTTKLNMIAEIVGGGTPDTKQSSYWNGDINWFSPTEVGKTVYLTRSEKTISQLGLQKSSAKLLPAFKTILFTSRAGIGDVGIITEESATNQGFQSLIVNEGTDVYFLYSYSNKIKKYALKHSAGSTFLEISGKELGKMDLSIPSLQEQSAIGYLFRTLDDLLASYKDNLANYQSLKATMLSKMFPKAGQIVPEIRLDGFEGEWEEKKLGEIVDIVGGGTPDTNVKEYWNGEINWFSPTEVGNSIYLDTSEKRISELGLQKSSAKILPANRTILFTSRAGIGSVGIITKDSTTNQGFQSLVTKKGTDIYFLFSYSSEITRYALKHSAGSTFLEISGKELGKMDIIIPTYDEQQAIGSYFSNLDNLINSYQEKITQLETLKKKLLQDMFI